ncbi:gamma-glutamylcyclotransferase family protein [Sphingobium sp. HBC34]|uniref:Gamma-glutamylcyclotransferase family protein n=1 Tax=Sphingobium cyanobacteriorum TaxID=3063954 RepID=A0ABT8ZRZ9_9SPHN|nr:gamma-glutamylcyclotransferase family protein [Sphingobium sp. HBC34]MDO7836500.1 gamma-glutamylcyclotransferase family protein [Sphingobium sp. HBC34]
MSEAALFVYGTLRAGFDSSMARRLRAEARLIGPARAQGLLYRITHYPGFVPGGDAWVMGDLFALADAATTLAWLDEYEECAPHFPPPHEYRRVRTSVAGPHGPVLAWTYAYARAVDGLARIDGGDFLSGG